MLVQTKVQIDKESYDFIKKSHSELNHNRIR